MHLEMAVLHRVLQGLLGFTVEADSSLATVERFRAAHTGAVAIGAPWNIATVLRIPIDFLVYMPFARALSLGAAVAALPTYGIRVSVDRGHGSTRNY